MKLISSSGGDVPCHNGHVSAGRADRIPFQPDEARNATSDIAPRSNLSHRVAIATRLQRLVAMSNEATGVALAIIDHDDQYANLNQRLAALNGISVEAHLGRSISSVVPEIGSMLTSLVHRVLHSRVPLRNVTFTARVPFVGGPLREWLANFIPVQLSSTSIGVAHTVIEVTERTRLEAVLTDIALCGPIPPSDRDPDPLTPREIEVLSLIGQGKTTKEIAALLSISGQTVGSHRKQICRKLDLHSTAETAAYAADQFGFRPITYSYPLGMSSASVGTYSGNIGGESTRFNATAG